jgi:hypothetical protein
MAAVAPCELGCDAPVVLPLLFNSSSYTLQLL